MAAGLPVICNRLDYVRSVVVDNEIGTSVDFSDEAALVRTIDEYVMKRDAIPAMSRKSQEVFKSAFNWQSASRTVYARIGELVDKTGTKGAEFDFAWIDGPEPWRSEVSGQEEQINVLNQEIARLHTVYTEHQVMMQSEIDSLRKRCAEETEKLANAPLTLIAYLGLRRVALLLKGLGGAFTASRKRL
jgi:hypothetical protein